MTALRSSAPETTIQGIDSVTFEVLRNLLMSIVDEVGATLERVAQSPVVSEGRDFSAAICDADGRLVADGNQDLPAHVGTLPHTARAVLGLVGRDDLAPGDVILMNDPYLGGTHAQDVRTIMPVFATGELVAFVQNSAHWTDAGGAVPGSFHAEAASSYGEALCIPPVHIVRRGVVDEGVLRLVLRNVRVPELARGDLHAQIAACRLGEQRLQELFNRYGIDLVRAHMAALQAYSETLLRGHFAPLRDGVYSFEDEIDFDPRGDRSKPVRVRLDVTINGDHARYDLSRSDGQALGAINCTEAMAESALIVATKALFPDVPASDGIYRALEIVNPRGRVTNAEFPAPVSGAFSTSYEAITACVFGCFLQIAPERSMACSGNIVSAVVGGYDPRPGYEREYVMYTWKEGGYGARPGKRDNHTAVSLYASGTRNEPVEVQERLYPILTERYELVTDSAGAGYHRGGLGVTRDFRLTHSDGTLSVLGSRAVAEVWGWDGGMPAMGSGLVYDAGGCGEVSLGVMRSGVRVEADRVIQFWEGGGGGWKDPLTRPQEWVLDDVIDGYVSVDAARDVYGVAITAIDEGACTSHAIDLDETRRLRTAGGVPSSIGCVATADKEGYE